MRPGFLVSLLLVVSGTAQDGHVRVRLTDGGKRTVIETDVMYVVNAPDQFLQLGLTTAFRPPLRKPPNNISLVVFSFTVKPMYRKDTDRRLRVVTDQQSWSLAIPNVLTAKGTTQRGAEMFIPEERPGLALNISLPLAAYVRAGRTIDDIFLEWMTTALKYAEVNSIAQANTLELWLGSTKVELTKGHIRTIRDFVKQITPLESP